MSNKNNERTFLLLISLLLAAVFTRLLFLFEYSTIWWDTGVYIGMGKYIFSHGTIGMWEIYRPLLWPLLLGAAWKLGLNPLIVGKIIVSLASIGCILVTYLIGKRFSPTVGIIAATLLSFTELFFMFTYIQITDIPSLFFSLLAIYLALKNRYFLAGICVGLAFNLRFPQALTFLVLLFAILWTYVVEENRKESLKNAALLCVGTAAFILPYFIYNYYTYNGAIFAPLIEAKNVVDLTVIAGRDYLYYFIELLKMNPLLIISVFGFLVYYYSDEERKPVFSFILIATVLLTAYYIHEPHKELRYALAFLPYYCLFAGYGIYMLSKLWLSHINFTSERIATGLLVIGTLIFVFLLVFTTQLTPEHNPQELDEYLSYFADNPGVTVFGPNPQILATSNVKLVRYSYWPRAQENYDQAGYVDYVMVNTCTVACHADDLDCPEKRDTFLQNISAHELVFNKTADACDLLIFKMNK